MPAKSSTKLSGFKAALSSLKDTMKDIASSVSDKADKAGPLGGGRPPTLESKAGVPKAPDAKAGGEGSTAASAVVAAAAAVDEARDGRGNENADTIGTSGHEFASPWGLRNAASETRKLALELTGNEPPKRNARDGLAEIILDSFDVRHMLVPT